jgi:hypothetical protein
VLDAGGISKFMARIYGLVYIQIIMKIPCFLEIYCFSMNTYFAPFSHGIPSDEEVREKNMISYYQWTPFFLGLFWPFLFTF